MQCNCKDKAEDTRDSWASPPFYEETTQRQITKSALRPSGLASVLMHFPGKVSRSVSSAVLLSFSSPEPASVVEHHCCVMWHDLSALLAAPALQQPAQSSFHNVPSPPASRQFEVRIKSRLTWLASFTVMSQLTFGVQATGIHLPIFQQEHRVVSSTCHLLDISVVDEPIHLWFRNDDLEVATYPRLSIRRVAPA